MLRRLEGHTLAGGAVLFLLMLSSGLDAQPLNDICADAEVVELADGLEVLVAGSTATGAAQDPETGNCGASSAPGGSSPPPPGACGTQRPPGELDHIVLLTGLI